MLLHQKHLLPFEQLAFGLIGQPLALARFARNGFELRRRDDRLPSSSRIAALRIRWTIRSGYRRMGDVKCVYESEARPKWPMFSSEYLACLNERNIRYDSMRSSGRPSIEVMNF